MFPTGNHDRVAALVYIAAFGPDAGESVNTLLGTFPADGPQPRSCRRSRGSCSSTGRSSPSPFAGGVPPQQAAFMADGQVPWGIDGLGGTIT